MPLDSLQYVKTETDWIKTVTHTEIVLDIKLESLTLQSQLEAFKQGEQTTDILVAIDNYEEQLAIIQTN